MFHFARKVVEQTPNAAAHVAAAQKANPDHLAHGGASLLLLITLVDQPQALER